MEEFAPQYLIWDEFLRIWPREKLAVMTLGEYTLAGSKDTFTNWIESRLDKMGSMWGGSSFKFGIYSRKDTEAKDNNARHSYSDGYAWYSYLGTIPEEAFSKVRSYIVRIVDLAMQGDLNGIESFDQLGDVFKWKIAFHYQNRQNPVIVSVFKKDWLAAYLGISPNIGMAALQREVAAKRPPEMGILEYSKSIWTKYSVDNGHDSTVEDGTRETPAGPQFVQYFAPVLDALRALGGEAKPEVVRQWITENLPVPASEILEKNKGGQTKFENKVAWARFYLTKAGFVDGGRRGVWALTPEGRETMLDDATCLAIFRDVQNRFRPAEGEDVPPAETAEMRTDLFSDPDRQFWFVGAAWDGEDQSDRFLSAGLWENGHDEMFADKVRQMKPGDRIAIKSSFVKKWNLPFENHGRPVSCMRIKAIGTITANRGDGRVVDVDWTPLISPRDWYFYTYRTTVVQVDRSENLAKRLILFTFAYADQDYPFWLSVPYFASKYVNVAGDNTLSHNDKNIDTSIYNPEPIIPIYTIDSITDDGCFIERTELELAVSRLKTKKNLILQGPPGTGKTWLAKKLAYALIGSNENSITGDRLRCIQFHPTSSYEDFVRGWRPSGDGKLTLVDGVFLEIAQAAISEPDQAYVLIVEEINRGNPAQVFGELLTLLEDSKRNSEDAIELAYRRSKGERIHLPKNLYIIGTMNIADRSLALVDLALRRRFAYLNLEPQINDRWRQWCIQKYAFTENEASLIASKMLLLNETIANDRTLGPQFRIGQSFVTPTDASAVSDVRRWFREIVDTELGPLLHEYWYDAPESALSAIAALKADL